MRMYQTGTLAALSLAMVFAFQNCGSAGMSSSVAQPGSSQNSVKKELQDMRSLIDSLNAEDLSCNQDSDCVAIPIGLRACGGPASYIKGSQLNARYDELLALADLLKDKTEQALRDSNAIGTCLAVLPPVVHCVQNVCQ